MSRPTPEEIQAFVDGELAQADADRVIEAIARDPELAAELDEALQVRALGHAMREEQQRVAAPADDLGRARTRAKRRRVLGIAIAAPLLAAGLAAYCVARGPGEPGVAEAAVGEQVAAALAPERSMLPRLSWAPVDRHRPYDVVRAGGAGAREALSFELLAKIERLGDPRALAAAHVLIGNVERAGQVLETAGESADAWSDRAALALIAGDAERALLAADRALAVAPEHGPALWNRALALVELGLDRTAVVALERLAGKGEPGWSEEAKRRAAELAAQRARREGAYRKAATELAAMVTGGPPAIDQADVAPGLARLYLYDAVRAAPSAERVRALEPLARALDVRQGGEVLARHVQQIAGRPFARRAQLAARYRELATGKLGPEESATLIRELRAAGREVEDLLLGALVLGGPAGRQVAPEHLEEYVALAERTGDPWFALLAVEQRANVALAAWDVARAEAVLRVAAGRCSEPGAIAFRCQRLTRLQTQVYLMMHRAKAAQEAWARSRRLAAAGGMPPQEDELLRFAGQIALIRDGTAASLHALTSAYFEEWGASGGTCAQVHDAREVVAQSLINQHRLDEARAHLLAPAPCEAPLGVRRAFLLGQLLRPGDTAAAAALRRELEALRADPARPAGERIVYDHVEGRALLAADPARGRAKLRGVIDAARGEEPLAALARSFSYAVLVQDAGQRAAWDEALALLAEERGARPPERCAFGASVETAAVFVARGADGGVAGVHVPLAVGQAPGEVRVPAELPRRLEGCPVVDVYARQPYYGRPDLLPPALAVRFRAIRSAGAGEPARPAAGPVVVVGNVAPPPELGLAPLQPIGATEGATLIEGAAATPERVLAAMRTASFVELHSHGLVGIAADDAAMLVLSPDPGGRYALTASEVAEARLVARPVVVLAACEAAAVGSAFHAGWGLADAFLEAGASAVIASPSPIRDASTPRFFAGVRARIQRGASPAEALRDERAAWPDPALRRSLDQLIVFQ